MADKNLAKEEKKLTHFLTLGMPTKAEMQFDSPASKLANWEKNAAPYLDRWRELRQLLGLSKNVEDIRPE